MVTHAGAIVDIIFGKQINNSFPVIQKADLRNKPGGIALCFRCFCGLIEQ